MNASLMGMRASAARSRWSVATVPPHSDDVLRVLGELCSRYWDGQADGAQGSTFLREGVRAIVRMQLGSARVQAAMETYDAGVLVGATPQVSGEPVELHDSEASERTGIQNLLFQVGFMHGQWMSGGGNEQ